MKPATHAHWKSATRSEQVPLFSHGLEAQSSISKKGKYIGVKTRHTQTLNSPVPTPFYHHDAVPGISTTKVVIFKTTNFPSELDVPDGSTYYLHLRLFDQFSSARAAAHYHL